jgi:LmbE family N-acetylglucosaminyl deacetylase
LSLIINLEIFMKFYQPAAQLYIPDDRPAEEALARTTHLGIAAHQDDLEIMAIEGILACFQQPDRGFTGVVVTDGRGSPRSGLYSNYTDDQMWQVRIKEQQKAAFVGEYATQILLDHPSAMVKNGASSPPVDDLETILRAARPQIVYTHNLADKHDTHVGVALKVIAAVRRLSPADRPQKLVGCEVWRNLDWLVDTDKVVFNASGLENLQMALVGVFDSQVTGGKRYDLATMGRRRANATYYASHDTDTATGLNFGMDLTPLITDDTLDPADYVLSFVARFARDVEDRLARLR